MDKKTTRFNIVHGDNEYEIPEECEAAEEAAIKGHAPISKALMKRQTISIHFYVIPLLPRFIS